MGARLCFALLLMFATSVARAETETDRHLRLSMMVATVPQASLRSALREPATYIGTDRALAGGLALDYACGDVLFLGVGSQYVFWVQDALSEGPAEGSEIDIRARIGASSYLTEAWQLFGYLAPGYSLLVPTRGARTPNGPRGLVIAGAVGAAVDLLPALFLSGEIGYQEGFQTGQQEGVTFDHQTRFMQVGLSLGVRIL
jgi:hypothetical protein